jgi:hypothetical protein
MSRKHKKWRSVVYEPKPDNILWKAEEVKFEDDKTTVAEKVTVPLEIWLQWQYVNSKMGHLEWGGVFDIKNGMVSNFRIPKQSVTGGSCVFDEDIGGNGHVHSHHSMGAFNSGTDDHSTRNMFDYAVVLSGYDYVMTKRVKVSEGNYKWTPVEIITPEMPKVDISNITEKKITYTATKWHGGGDYYGGWDGSLYDNSVNHSPCRQCTEFPRLCVTDKWDCATYRDWYNYD